MNSQSSQIIQPVSYIDPKQSITIYTSQTQQAIPSERQKSQVYYINAKPQSPITIISKTPLVDNPNSGKSISQQQQQSKFLQEKKSNVSEEIWQKKYQLLMESYEKLIEDQKKENKAHEKLKIRYQKLKDELNLFGPIEQKVNGLIEENNELKNDLQSVTESWKSSQADKEVLQQAYIQLNQEKNKQDDNIQKLNDYLEIKDKEIADIKKRYQEFEMVEIEDMNKRASEYEVTLTSKQKEVNELKLKVQKIGEQQLQDLKKQAQLEEAIILLGAENERLHSIQKEKFKENDSLKKKILTLEKQITDLKVEMENQEVSDEQTMGLKKELENSHQTVDALQSELNTYKIQYQEMMRISCEKDQWHEQIVENENEIERKNYEIEQLKLKLMQCENKVDELKKSLANLYEFENKLDKLVTENQKLQQLVNNKQEQINNLNNKNSALEKKLKEGKQWEINSARLDQTIYEKDRQISELNDKIQQQEGRIQVGVQNENQCKEEIQKFEMLMHKLEEDNDNLKTVGKEKEALNQESKAKIKELELRGIEAYNEINSLKYSLQNLEENYSFQQQELERTQSLLQQRMNEVVEYKKKYRECESNYQELINNSKGSQIEVIELKEKIQLYEKEIQRLYQLLKERDSSLNECKGKLSKCELECKELHYRINEIEDMNYQQKQELSKSQLFMNSQIDGLQEQKIVQARLKSENQQLKDAVKDYEERIKNFEEKVAGLQKDIEKKDNENREFKKAKQQATELSEEVKRIKDNMEQLQKKYLKEKEEKEEQELKNSQLQLEIEKEKGKSSGFEIKLKQSDETNKKLQEAINKLNEDLARLNQELLKGGALGGAMEGEIEELKKQTDKLKKQLKEKEDLVNRMQGKMKQLEKDSEDLQYFKERCSHFETNQTFELTGLKEQLSNSTPSHALEKLRQDLSDLKNENARLKAQLEILQQYETQALELTNKLTEKQQETEQLQAKFNDNMAQFERSNWMAAEIQRLTLVLAEKEAELAGFKSKYIENSELMKKLEDQLCMVVITSAEMEALRTRLEEKEREMKESRRTGISRYRANKEKDKKQVE